MTFDTRLGAAQVSVEAHLAAILAAQGRTPPRLLAAMRHAVLGGGKRLRPLLVLETAALFDVADSAALDTAAAVELVHCYSLVHDDLPAIDNDAVRRGRPTVWKAYDEWTAILTGDALLTLAFEVVARPGSMTTCNAQLTLVRELAMAAGPVGMVGGQALDLAAEKLAGQPRPDAAGIRRLQAMKTGNLIRFACVAGPFLAGSGLEDLGRLAAYGEALGLAFQIADDLLDAAGDAAVVGKAVAKDAAAGKATLVSLLGLPAARRALADAEAAAIATISPYGAKSGMLIDIARFVARRDR